MGRERKAATAYQNRPIDLDILLVEEEIIIPLKPYSASPRNAAPQFCAAAS